MVSESLSDDLRAVERRRKIPLIGRCLARLGKGEDDVDTRVTGLPRGPIVITGARPLRTAPAARIDRSGRSTPQREREIRFPDELP